MKISAVLVTYNRLNLLKKCLHNLLTQSYPLNDIYIVNNNSSDGTTKYLNGLHNSKVHSFNLDKNLGGAGGFSLGTKLAYEKSNSDAFWLMDDDTMPTINSLKYLNSAAEKLHEHFGFLCSNVRWWKNNNPCNIPTVSRQGWTKYASDGLVKVHDATFVSFLVPRFMVKNYGLPLAPAFIWGDDTEYSTRLSQKCPAYFVSNSIIIHKAANPDLSSENIIFERTNNRIARYKYMYRNRLYVERKYGSIKSLLKWIVLLNLILIKIPFKSKNRRIKRMFYTFYGIISSFFFNPKVRFPKK